MNCLRKTSKPLRLIQVLLFLWSAAGLSAQQNPGGIVIDGRTDDWAASIHHYSDPENDGKDLDMTGFSVTNDDRYLYIRLRFANMIHLGQNNNLFLEIDLDNNPLTGYRVNGIGAELGWHFGGRYGYYKRSAHADYVSHSDIDLVFLPSTEAGEYEIAISLDAKPVRNESMFTQDSIAILFWEKTPGGDLMPDSGQVFRYRIERNNHRIFDPIDIARATGTAIRLLTWNVFNDGLTDSLRQPAFRNILQAIRPDVLVLNECWNTPEPQLKDLLTLWLPDQSKTWYVEKLGEGNMLASRYEIRSTWKIHTNDNIAAFLLNTAMPGLQEFLVLNCHLTCCNNEGDRLLETAAIISFLAEHFTIGKSGKKLSVPVVMAGDFNLVEGNEPYKNLMAKPSPASGRNNSWFKDAIPRQTDRPMAYTWRDASKIFSPSRLDYIFYSHENLSLIKSFVLTSGPMSDSRLRQYGLSRHDTRLASDHLPVVADFVPVKPPEPQKRKLKTK